MPLSTERALQLPLCAAVLAIAIAPLACKSATTASTARPPKVEGASPIETTRYVTTVRAAEDLQSAFKRAILAASPAVVSIYSTRTATMPSHPFEDLFGGPGGPREFQQRGLGSGVIISADGLILTNNHVIEGADEIRVLLENDQEHIAKVIGADPPTDLALLSIEATNLKPARLGNSDALEVGDWVLAIGNPFDLPKTVSAGIVSGVGRGSVGIVNYGDFIQTDAAVNPGNSGGPLVNLAGEVVGINTAIASRTGSNNGVAFAIPINIARTILDQLKSHGQVVRGYIGVIISELNPEMAKSFGYNGDKGILIQDTAKDGPATKAGLREGEIITKLNGKPITNIEAFRAEIARTPPGSKIQLEVWRDSKTRNVTVELGKLPQQGPAAVAAAELHGMTIRDIDPQFSRQFDLDEKSGAVIVAVDPRSPAAEAGLRPGDVIESVGKTRVKSAASARAALEKGNIERGIRLRIRRGEAGQFVLLKRAKSK